MMPHVRPKSVFSPPALDCSDFGSHSHHATGTGYYPDDSPIEGGYVDVRDHPLHTLQVST